VERRLTKNTAMASAVELTDDLCWDVPTLATRSRSLAGPNLRKTA